MLKNQSNLPYEKLYINQLIKKYVGFIYYGCCGIKELHNINNFSDTIKEFSFKYGLLLYLREELSYLKNKSYEYYVNILIYNI